MLALCLSAPRLAYANPADGEITQAASTHYASAMKALEQERYADAINHLEAALAISPRPLVLYNLGQAYAAAGQPLKAYRTLNDYLAAETSPIAPERADLVRSLIRAQERKLAALSVAGLSPGATLRIDGSISHTAGEHWLPPGRHTVLVTTRSSTTELEVELAAGEKRTLQLAVAEPRVKELGVLITNCSVPGVTLIVNGAPSGVTPVRPRVVEAGRHRVEWKREGYRPSASTVVVAPDSAVTASCALTADPESPSRRSKLQVVGAPPGATVFVDGRRYHGEGLATGPHRVSVTRAGYLPWNGELRFGAGEKKRVRVALRLTPEVVSEREKQVEGRRFWSLVAGASGLGLTAGAAGLFLDNRARYDRWQKTQGELDRRATAQDESERTELARAQADNNRVAGQIGRLDQVTVGVGTLGVSALVIGAFLYFSSDGANSDEIVVQTDQGSAGTGWRTTW